MKSPRKFFLEDINGLGVGDSECVSEIDAHLRRVVHLLLDCDVSWREVEAFSNSPICHL